jgi:hypothetical protein
MHLPIPMRVALCATFTGAFVPGQQLPGDLMLAIPAASLSVGGAAGVSVLDRNAAAVQLLANQPAAMQEISTVVASPWQSRLAYAATDGLNNVTTPGACYIVEVAATQGQLVSATVRGGSALQEDFISSMAVVGTDLIYQGQHSLGRLSLATGVVSSLYNYAQGEGAFGMTTDGRHVYAGLNPRQIVRIDLIDPSLRTPLITLPSTVFDVLMAMAMLPDGSLLAARGNPLTSASLLQIDTQSGLIVQSRVLPVTGVRAMAVDPLTGEILVSGTSSAGGVLLSLASVSAQPQTLATFGGEASIALRRSWPLHVHGPLCPASNGSESRIGANVPPRIGESGYAVDVRTLPGSLAVLVLGLRPQGLVEVLWPLQTLGAPACALGLNPLATQFAVTNSAGNASTGFVIPGDPTLRGAALDSQWIVLDPPNNALGITTSQVGTLVVE